MNALPSDKQLAVLFRLEPGCLGPQGIDFVEEFCSFINKQPPELHYARFHFVARYDKKLPEWEYSINKRNLNDEKVALYLNLFQTNKHSFEEEIEELLVQRIELFFSRS